MKPNDEVNWWMTSEGRLLVGVGAADQPGMASGTVCPSSRSGVIRMFRGEPAKLTCLPRGLLDELSAHFPGVRWWVQDLPERAPAKTAAPRA